MSVDRSILPAVGPDPTVQFPAFQRIGLASGVQVWAVERRELPVITCTVVLPAGSAADLDGHDGLTAFTADLFDEATMARSSLDLHDALARLGAELDIDVGADVTVISVLALARHAPDVFAILDELVSTPRFDPVDVDRVRQLRLARVRQLRDVPSAVADRALARTIYGSHPYGHTSLGDERTLAAITREAIVAHHRRYALSSAVQAIIVGDLTPDRAARLVESTIGASRSGSEAAGVAAVPARTTGPRVVLVNRPGAAQSELRVGRVAAPRSTPDYFPLLVCNAALGGQFVSRINMNLREDKGFTYGARSAFEFRRAPGPFVVATSVQTDATAPALAEILRELDELGGARPLSESELSLARSSLTRGYPRGFETVEQIARAVGIVAVHGLPHDHFDRFTSRVAAVDVAAVTDVARRYLAPSAMDVVVVGDRSAIGDAVDALGIGARIDLEAADAETPALTSKSDS